MSNVPNDLKYAQTHEWARLTDDTLVRVGITDHAQAELGDLVFVELPELGTGVTAGEQTATVESVKAASDIYSPVSGEVVEINGGVVDNPEAVNEDSYLAWLFAVRVDDTSDLDNLMDAESYKNMIDG